MMSHISKHNQQYSTQSGVALMLSVLVLAAVTAIAFSLATIVFIELRSSRDVVRSEPALYATLGVTEEALFQYKRAVDESVMDVSSCFPSNQNICSLNGVNMINPAPELLSEEVTPKVETIYAGQSKTLPLFELGNWTPIFSRIDLQLVPLGSTGSITAQANWIDTTGNSGTDPIGTLNESSARLPWSGFLSNRLYELELINPTPNNMLVSIWSYGSGGDLKGLPIIAKRVLKIVADYSGFTRTYLVDIPVGISTLSGGKQNVALASNGATPSPSSTINSSYPASSAIDGDRTGAGWGAGTGGWNDAGTVPSYFDVIFSGTKNITEIHVYTLGNTWPVTPDASTPADQYGLLNFTMEYWNGSGWVAVPGGTITSNTLMWRKATFPAISTDRIRISVQANRGGYSRIVEVEAYE